MDRQVVRSPRVLAATAVVLIAAIGLVVPTAAAAPQSHRQAASQGGGLGNPSADSVPPQIPPGANVVVVRAWTERAIRLRLRALRAAASAATAKAALTASDRSLLLAQIATDRAGLDSLATSVRSDTAVTQLQGAIDSMITDYRVFTVVVPQVDVAINLDAYDFDIAQLQRTATEISAAVTAASALGNARAIERLYSTLMVEVQTANSQLQSARSAVLSASPSSYPGAVQVIASAQNSVSTVRTEVSAARSDIEIIAQLLRKRLGGTTRSIS